MARTGADLITETLTAAGIKRVYGVAGDSLNGITDSLRRARTIEWVHMRNEEAGAFAAGAEAHLTGELAVCAGSCGPGNLHLINGLFDAHRNQVPLLAIAAHIPSSRAVPQSINNGTPITLAHRDHPVSRAIVRFAHEYLIGAPSNGSPGASPGAAQGRLARLRDKRRTP